MPKTIDTGTVRLALRARFKELIPNDRYMPSTIQMSKEKAEELETLGLPYLGERSMSLDSYLARMCGWLMATSDEELAAAYLAWKTHTVPSDFNLMSETLDIFCYVRGLKTRG